MNALKKYFLILELSVCNLLLFHLMTRVSNRLKSYLWAMIMIRIKIVNQVNRWNFVAHSKNAAWAYWPS